MNIVVNKHARLIRSFACCCCCNWHMKHDQRQRSCSAPILSRSAEAIASPTLLCSARLGSVASKLEPKARYISRRRDDDTRDDSSSLLDASSSPTPTTTTTITSNKLGDWPNQLIECRWSWNRQSGNEPGGCCEKQNNRSAARTK